MSKVLFHPKNRGKQFASPIQQSVFTQINPVLCWKTQADDLSVDAFSFTGIRERENVTKEVIENFIHTTEYINSGLKILNPQTTGSKPTLNDHEIFNTKIAEFEFLFTLGKDFILQATNRDFYLLSPSEALDQNAINMQISGIGLTKQQDETDDQFAARQGRYQVLIAQDNTIKYFSINNSALGYTVLTREAYESDFISTMLLAGLTRDQDLQNKFQETQNKISNGELSPQIMISPRDNIVPLIRDLHPDTRFISAYSQLRLYTVPTDNNIQTIQTQVEFTENSQQLNVPLVMIACPPSEFKLHTICPPTYNLPCYFNEEEQYICLENFNPLSGSPMALKKLGTAFNNLPSSDDSPEHNKDLAVISCTILVEYMEPSNVAV